MASLGQLVVQLSANTAQFTSAMDKAAYLADKNFNRMMKSARNFAVGIAAAFSVRETLRYMQSIVDQADEFAKMSQKIGVSVEALSSFKYAADLAGSSFDVLTKGIARFTRNVSDASNGMAAPLRAFEFLNIAIEDSNGRLRSSEDLLLDVADRFSKMADGVRKSALAQELFGRSGVELIPFLNEGREGLAKMREEAERLGIVFSQDTARAAEEFNDNITRAKAFVEGLTITLGQNLLPVLNDIFDQMSRTNGAVTKFSKSSIFLAEVAINVVNAFNLLKESLFTVYNAAKTAEEQIKSLLTADFKGFAKAGKEFAESTQEGWQTTIFNAEELWAKHWERMADGAKEGSAAVAQSIDFDGISARYKKLSAEGDRLKESLRMPKEILHDDLERYKQLLDAGTISQETHVRAVRVAIEKYKEQKKEVKEVSNLMRDMGATFSSAFEDAIVGGQKFSDILRGLEQDLLRIFIRLKVTEPLMKSVFGGQSGSTGGSFGSNLLSSIISVFNPAAGMSFSGVASTDTSLAGQVQAFGGGITAPSAKGNAFYGGNLVPFASGGILGGPMAFPMAGRRTGIAGEAGPEAILPLMRTSGGDLGVKSSGGGKTEVNVYAPPGSNVKQERQQEGDMERINIFIDEAVAGNVRPGTKTYRAMRSQFGLGQQLTPR